MSDRDDKLNKGELIDIKSLIVSSALLVLY